MISSHLIPLTRAKLSSASFSVGVLVAAACYVSTCAAGVLQRGAEIYREQCASCHGAKGQGVDDVYSKPLAGERSIEQLARRIERTMPEGEPEVCVGDDARQVAEYIYDAFYSLEARQRNGLASPRASLARLTAVQYRNAVADLIGELTPPPQGDGGGAQPGLRAQYFQSEGMSKANELRHERVDRRIAFDFAEGSPAEGITADQFAIIWQGSIVAEETGHYEFRISTQNGARLYFNMDPAERRGKLRDDSGAAGQSAFLDAWVGSGKMRERSARLFLLGGRSYPVRLEFFKYLEPTASVKLEWKPPQGVWEVLNADHLSTASSSRTFVVDTPMPADDRSLGYERGSSISPDWHAATTSAAVSAA
ncbi:MAG: PA14 domain-containing protein, partial [Planctomycetota bacterium]